LTIHGEQTSHFRPGVTGSGRGAFEPSIESGGSQLLQVILDDATQADELFNVLR
jgi:hypothetical protein